MSEDLLAVILDALAARQVPHMVVGSLATNYYGIPRSTQGADIVVELGEVTMANISNRIGNRLTLVAVILLATAIFGQEGESPFCNNLTVHNKGIGGQNTRDGKARFRKDVLDLKPDYLFIYFGLNDALNEPKFVALDEFIANLGWMIEEARRAGIRPVLCTIHHVQADLLMSRHKPESYGEEGPNPKIDRYNAAIRKLAAERKVPLVEFCQALDEAGGATLDKGCLVRNPANSGAKDGVHLTPDGYRVLARCFFDAAVSDLKGNETIVCLGDSVTYGSGMKGQGTAMGETYPACLRHFPIPNR